MSYAFHELRGLIKDLFIDLQTLLLRASRSANSIDHLTLVHMTAHERLLLVSDPRTLYLIAALSNSLSVISIPLTILLTASTRSSPACANPESGFSASSRRSLNELESVAISTRSCWNSCGAPRATWKQSR